MRWLSWVPFVAACGGDGDDDADTDTDPVADTDLGPDTDPPRDMNAVLRVLGYEFPTGDFGGSVLVDFFRTEQPYVAEMASTLPVDTCAVTLHSTGTPPGTTTPSDERPGAGLVTAGVGGEQLSLVNGIATLDGWPTGQTVSFSASGAEVPVFAVPALLVIPDAPLGAASAENPDGSVDLSWGGASTPSPVRISVAGSFGVVDCSVTDSGSFTVPAAELAQVESGGQYLVARSVAVVESLPGVTVTGWAQVSAFAD